MLSIGLLSGYPVEPIDIPPDTRHLDATLAALTLTDRAFGLLLPRWRAGKRRY